MAPFFLYKTFKISTAYLTQVQINCIAIVGHTYHYGKSTCCIIQKLSSAAILCRTKVTS